jgi:SAM-dependent methyltransferase
MVDARWFERFFGEDYFEIYRDAFTPEGTARDAEGIVALLELAPGARVLDVACGHGRHAVPLARRGLAVTGHDFSPVMLARARRDAAAAGVRLGLVRGDMRRLPFGPGFDAVLSVFTSFGYFADPADDLATLRCVRAALAPGGRFLLETLHAEGLAPRFQPRIEYTTSAGARVERDYVWDRVRDVIEDRVRLTRADGSRAEYATAVRLRAPEALAALAREAGLAPIAWHGGLDGSALAPASRRLVMIAERAPAAAPP